MLNFFRCFQSELATDEVVLHGTIRLDSKIRSQNVHFHDSFWREQTLAATKLFLSLTGIDFAVAVSSRAVRISSRAVRVFPALSFRRVRPSHGTFSLMVFQGNCSRGRTGHMIIPVIKSVDNPNSVHTMHSRVNCAKITEDSRTFRRLRNSPKGHPNRSEDHLKNFENLGSKKILHDLPYSRLLSTFHVLLTSRHSSPGPPLLYSFDPF